jgi:hypothetical protein
VKFNKHQQAFNIMGRFHVLENGEAVEYCRIKFVSTKHTQVVKNDLIQSGDFKDDSLARNRTFGLEDEELDLLEAGVVDMSANIVDTINKGEPMEAITSQKIDLTGAVTLQTFVEELVEDDDSVKDEEPAKFTAINPKDEESEHNLADLEAFCEENTLDPEAVQACLNGTQKTHKKWKFRS